MIEQKIDLIEKILYFKASANNITIFILKKYYKNIYILILKLMKFLSLF